MQAVGQEVVQKTKSLKQIPLSSSSENPQDLPTTGEDLVNMKQLFEQVLVSEILNELKFSQDVIAKRADRRKDYVENRAKLILALLNIPFSAVRVVGTLFPPAQVATAAVSIIGQAVLKGADLVTDKVAAKISEKAQQAAQENMKSLPGIQDFKLLKEYLEIFAEQASLRYEPLISKKISSNSLLGIIPLARVAARRVVDYLGRIDNYYSPESLQNTTFTDICLEGLILGRSGKKKEGYGTQDNPIEVKNPKRSKRFKKKPVKHTAEGMLSRGAMCSLQVTDPYGIPRPVYYRTEPISKVGDSEISDKKNRKYRYAATSFLNEKDINKGPKYEYMLVDTYTSHRYGFDGTSKGSAQFAGTYQFSTYKPSVYLATLDQVFEYSEYYMNEQSAIEGDKGKKDAVNPLSFIQWIISRKLNQEDATLIKAVWVTPYIRAKSNDKMPVLEKMDFLTYLDLYFNGSEFIKSNKIISGNFEGISFKSLNFQGLTLQNVNLDGSDCRFIQASSVSLINVSMNRTKLACADLRNAKLIDCETASTKWGSALTHGMVVKNSTHTFEEIVQSQLREKEEFDQSLSLAVMRLEKQFGEKLDTIYGLVESHDEEIKKIDLTVRVFCQESYDKFQDYEYFKKRVNDEIEALSRVLESHGEELKADKEAIKKLKQRISQSKALYETLRSTQEENFVEFRNIDARLSGISNRVDVLEEKTQNWKGVPFSVVGITGKLTNNAAGLKTLSATAMRTNVAGLIEFLKNYEGPKEVIGAKNLTIEDNQGSLESVEIVAIDLTGGSTETTTKKLTSSATKEMGRQASLRTKSVAADNKVNKVDDDSTEDGVSDQDLLSEAFRKLETVKQNKTDYDSDKTLMQYEKKMNKYKNVLASGKILESISRDHLTSIISNLNNIISNLGASYKM